MRYEAGDEIIFNPHKAVALNVLNENEPKRRVGFITGFHPAEEKPYDIEDSRAEAFLGDDDCIIRRILPRCEECGSKRIWHDREEQRFCPFCTGEE